MSNILDKIKLSGTTYDIIDATAIHSMDGYYTSGQTNDAITAATSALAESIAEQGYQTSGDVQNAISGKADTTAVTQSINEATSGKVDNSTYTAYTAATDATLSGKADVGDIPSVSGYADSVKYNSTSKYVEFYHGGTGGTKVFEYDASPFLIDGMVQNVEIKDVEISGETVTCLVISFNTDAGKQDINIPLTEIFDPSNYYTKTEIDQALSGKADTSAVTADISAAVSGKVDTNTYTAYTAATDGALGAMNGEIGAINNEIGAIYGGLTAHTANTDIHVTTSDKSTWSGKQDALVSGTNIKTINNESILGSGNINVQTLPTVSGTTLVFS